MENFYMGPDFFPTFLIFRGFKNISIKIVISIVGSGLLPTSLATPINDKMMKSMTLVMRNFWVIC